MYIYIYIELGRSKVNRSKRISSLESLFVDGLHKYARNYKRNQLKLNVKGNFCHARHPSKAIGGDVTATRPTVAIVPRQLHTISLRYFIINILFGFVRFSQHKIRWRG